MATPQDLLIALSRARTLVRTRTSRNPELVEALQDVRDTQESLGWLVVRIAPEGFKVQGELVPDDFGILGGLRNAIELAGIREVRFQEVLAPELLEEFLRRIDPSHDAEGETPAERFRGLEGDLGLSFRKGGSRPAGMTGSIQDLFGEGRHGSDDEDREDLPEEEYPERVAPAETDLFPHLGGERPGDGSGASRPPLPDEIEDLLQAYLEADGPARAGRAEEIRAASVRMKEAREMGTLGNLVEALAEEGSEPPGDQEVLSLAQELTTPAIASQLVVRLGETRDEDQRARYIRLAPALGREMALALADALGEARDRYQRRSFMDAMVALGPTGHEVAETMVQDPRWFVVRNGVSLLGEIGGEGVVSHLTTTLANSDARVRRETVQALAKVGGENAAMLLQGMLDDPEAEVRAMTCRAVGVLKVEKSFKTLMKLLEDDQNEDVQVEALQALGRIGDPGAVPLIEKRALGGLFSKPSREIRIAAYRALAGIGTPHAVQLLEKASKDGDTGIRTVAQSLLAGRE